MSNRIPITQEIQTAIRKAIAAYGSQSELSRQCGIPQKNISNYISSANAFMNRTTWERFYPFICTYLKEIPIPAEESSKIRVGIFRNDVPVINNLVPVMTRKEVIFEILQKIVKSDLPKEYKDKITELLLNDN